MDMSRPVFAPKRLEHSTRGDSYAYWAPDQRVALKLDAFGATVVELARTHHTIDELSDAFSRLAEIEPHIAERQVGAFVARAQDAGLLLRHPDRGPNPLPVQPPTRINPTILYLHLSVLCNLSCIYCYNVEHREAAKDEKALTLEETKAVLDMAASNGIVQVNFTGGEPMMSKNWQELAEYARSLGMSLTLISNANLITDRNAEQVARLFSWTIVSLDSPDRETNDRQRGKGSYDRTMRGIRALVDIGYAGLVLRPVITRHNIDTIAGFPRFAAENCGTKRFILANYVPNSKEELETLDLKPGLDQIEALNIAFAAELAKIGGQELDDNLGTMERAGRCGAGSSIVSVEFNGDIYPCQASHDPGLLIGNVRDGDFLTLLGRSTVANDFRSSDVNHIDICKGCSFNAICGGGCRATAFKVFRSMTAHNRAICDVNQVGAWNQIWQHLETAPAGTAVDPEALIGCSKGCASADH